MNYPGNEGRRGLPDPAACLIRLRPIDAPSHCFSAGRSRARAASKTGPQEIVRMATAAPNQGLPIFYRAIEPLNVTQHGQMKVRPVLNMSEVAKTHAIPLTTDEFALVQRHYPIVFSIGEKPIPIGLMGLNENVNVFLEDDGRAMDPSLYIPAYIRRYPFLL